jgi:hypothetical protein
MKINEIYVEAKAWKDGLSCTVGLKAELLEGESIGNCTKALRKQTVKLALAGLQEKARMAAGAPEESRDVL